MNYKSQLKGWAVDRIIETWKIFPPSQGGNIVEMISTQADALAEYAYVPREDLESTAKDLFELVRKSPPNESSIDALIGTLEHIKEDRRREGIDTVDNVVPMKGSVQ